MDLLQLKYFRMTAQLEHMTKAAQKLNIAQPSLSKTISRLEEELGVSLFDRQGRQIRLNSFGKAFLRRVENVFMELNEGKRELQDLAGLDQGVVSFAVTNPRILPGLLGSFLQRYPHVRFRQFLGSTLSMKEQLETGEIDLCISSVPIEGLSIDWQSLLEEEIFLTVSVEHPLAGQQSIDLKDAADEPFISLRTGHGFRDITDAYCRQAGFTPNITFEGDEPAVIRELVKAGLGVAFLPALSWIGVSDPLLQPLPIRNPKCQRTIGVARARGRYQSKAAQQFYDFVVDYLQKMTANLQDPV
ncbi:LysR family transcriptional regulator [Heliobacterium chlorum]|uniref:LysR family transcriptional regulator n=1 Tax=Heliobacterium chlorum TaxID=2698 RepID=A0ABR7T4T6_HELCL|nr:LysR family transcriptional regulator [Heliobacterium chlorum]MBC9785370.1 LysR family transcriptional regulator [Heliobacterium chlorum]